MQCANYLMLRGPGVGLGQFGYVRATRVFKLKDGSLGEDHEGIQRRSFTAEQESGDCPFIALDLSRH